jgi:hypothetical protein
MNPRANHDDDDDDRVRDDRAKRKPSVVRRPS